MLGKRGREKEQQRSLGHGRGTGKVPDGHFRVPGWSQGAWISAGICGWKKAAGARAGVRTGVAAGAGTTSTNWTSTVKLKQGGVSSTQAGTPMLTPRGVGTRTGGAGGEIGAGGQAGSPTPPQDAAQTGAAASQRHRHARRRAVNILVALLLTGQRRVFFEQ